MVQGLTAGLWKKNVVCSISFDLFPGKFLNLVQCMPLASWFSGHVFKGQSQSQTAVPSITFDPLTWKLPFLVQWIPIESRYTDFQVTWSKLRQNFWS